MHLQFKNITFLLLYICCITIVKAQSADFTIATSNNLFCSPQVVTFTQNCSSTPDAFIWNFGNGQIGSAAVENITFNITGTYTISLTAVYATNAVSVTKTITINPLPTVSVIANTNYLCQPGNAVFTATASANVASYTWNFGDGTATTTTATNTISHSFASYNIFTVSVTANTINGCTAMANTTIEVKKMPITASVVNQNGCIPANTTFTANSILPLGDAPLNYIWDYGNGNTANTTTNNSSFPYNNTNTITTANVTIISNQGCTQTYNFPTLAYGTPPFNTNATTILNRDTFCGSETIAFKATATDGVNYNWDFGDGTNTSTTDTLITHKYTTLGNKVVIVTPSFNGCNGTTDTININITGVIANYNFTNTCSNKNTFQFSNVSLGNISKFYWNFNNQSIDSIVNNPNHTYGSVGSFSTKLTVIDNVTGCVDSFTTMQYTAIPSLTSSAAKICKDSIISYNVLNTYNSASNYNYIFNMAGVSYNNGTNPLIYTSPSNFGTFNDYVVIQNPAGNTCNDTLYLPNTTLIAGPNVFFTPSSLLQCRDANFLFTNNSFATVATDTIIKWQWQYGDNSKDSIQQPLPKNYNAAGNYNVILTATDKNNCKQSFSVLITANPIPFIKAFPLTDTICQGQILMLSAYTNDTLTWQPFATLSCNNCDTTYATPTLSTNYIARSINSYGCISYDTAIITVINPLTIAIQPTDTTICPGQFVQFRNNLSAKYLWQPSTYLSATTIGNPSAIVNNSIIYTVIATDSVGCFSDTALITVNTFTPPTVNAGNDTIVTYNNSFTLQPTLSSNISSVAWSPLTNNLSCNNCTTPSGLAFVTTLYNIAVTSINGCTTTDSVKVTVNCSKENLFIPTAFTPNNDGLNDYFYPMARGYKIINAFVVYNRWGQKLFEKKNFLPNQMQLGWDGTYKGVKINEPQGLVWYVEATCDLGQSITKKGTLTLLQ